MKRYGHLKIIGLSTLFITIICSACAKEFYTYKPGEGSDITTLTLRNNGAMPMGTYSMRNVENCSGGAEYLTPEPLEPDDVSTINIEAGRPFLMYVTWKKPGTENIFGVSDSKICPFIQFTPRTNSKYVLIHDDACEFQLKTADGESVEFKVRQWKETSGGRSEFGRWCA